MQINSPNKKSTSCSIFENKRQKSTFFQPSDPEEIDRIISYLKSQKKNSSAHDNINDKFLKYLQDEFKMPTSILANISVTNGIYPVTSNLYIASGGCTNPSK